MTIQMNYLAIIEKITAYPSSYPSSYGHNTQVYPTQIAQLFLWTVLL